MSDEKNYDQREAAYDVNRGWPGDRVDTPEVAKLRAERDAACRERDHVQSTVSEHRTGWARVNQENDKLRSDLTKAEASIVEHKAELRTARAEIERLRAAVKVVIELEWGDPAKGCKVSGGVAWRELAEAVGSLSESVEPKGGDDRG